MASCMPMIISLILTSAVVVLLHTFVMGSVDGFDRYGDNGGSYREWIDFEKQKNHLDR
jgi:hypothetical protein